jgi:dihydroorotase
VNAQMEARTETGPILIRGGRVVDPANGRDGEMDVLVEDGRIARVGRGVPAPKGALVLEADRLIVAPGLVDMHVHLREPGRENAETIETGTRAAAAGGVTSVAAMPNTEPPMDTPSHIEFVRRKAAESGAVRVWPVGAVTVGRAGEAMAEIGALVAAGCVAVSDDGSPVANSQLLRRAMEYVKLFDIPVIEHSEDPFLMADGVMNEGPLSTRLGYKGVPRQAESVAVARNIALAELTGARLHLAHVSSRDTVALVRQAKKRGLRVTAEAAPHHFTLTEDAVAQYGANAKMNPPLRAEEDRQALLDGLADGTIDAIASDHAPHTKASKEQEFSAAPFGIIGLETLLPLTVTQLVEKNILSWPEAIRRLSLNPARILKIPAGTLTEGEPADVVLIDPKEERTLTSFSSKSRNTPFLGWTLRGFAQAVLVGGRVVFRRDVLRPA